MLMLLEDVRGQNRNFKSGTGLLRQSEGEKDQDRGREKVEVRFARMNVKVAKGRYVWCYYNS